MARCKPIANRTLVDVEVLVAAGFPGMFGAQYKAFRLDNIRFFFDRHQALVGLLAQNLSYALAGIPGVQKSKPPCRCASTAFERGMGQCNRRERFRNMLEFNGVVLQELTTRRDIEEKVFRRDAGSNGARRFFSLAQLAAVAAEFGGDVVLNRSALDGCVETAEMEAKASPRKPIVCSAKRSSAD